MAEVSKDYQDLAKHIIVRDKGLKAVQKEYERMSRLDYQLPEPLNTFEYIMPIISTAPYDSLRGATRALSNLDSALNIHPVTVYQALEGGQDDESKAAQTLANYWETVLMWQLAQAEARGRSISADVVWSVSVYDEAIGKLIHLPTQFKAAPLGDEKEAVALMNGEWAHEIHDVKTVYVDYSRYGIDSVMTVNVKSARQMIANWGKEAAGFVITDSKKNKLDLDDPQNTWVEYDLIDNENRVVWASIGRNEEDTNGQVILPAEPWLDDPNTNKQVPFSPFIASAGGTGADLTPEFQRKPMLFPVLQAEQWAMTNISGTIMFSQQLATAASATDVFTGPGAEDIPEDWTGPRRRINLNVAQTYQQIQDAGLDTGLREIFDRLEASIQRATVADVLVTAQPISGEQAFASYNLQVQQALASLGGIKDVSEKYFAQLFKKMLLITHYTGGELAGYGQGLDKYVIDSEDIDPDNIQLTVELKADVPADRVQRVTAAVTMARDLNYPTKKILEFLGETDPEGSMRQYKREQVEMADLAARLEGIQKKISGEYQEEVMAAAQAIVEQQVAAAEAQAKQQPQGGGQVPTERPISGPEFDPSQGGTPPAVASPEGTTREASNGNLAEIPPL